MKSGIKKLVLFGAGKIGRSFIAQLFSAGGYHVVFVDIVKAVTDELNRRGSYQVIMKSDVESVITVNNVRGVFAGDEKAVADEICHADIIATAVGQNGLQGIFSLLAKGLLCRQHINPNNAVDIIIAENLRNAAGYFEKELKKLLPAGYPFESSVGLVETSIGKMVPVMTAEEMKDDLLKVYAEPYNTLILDKIAFKNPIPDIEGLEPKEHMKAWVDRKLFIHNLGHAAAAYLGYMYNPEFIYLYEALEVPEVLHEVKATMQQSAEALVKKYPEDFTHQLLDHHIEDLIQRFKNRQLGDTIFRVGCDLPRKLGPDDRLTGAIRLAQEMKVPYNKILYALVCGCRFRATDEKGNLFPADIEFDRIYKTGIRNVLTNICGFDEKKDAEIMIELEKFNNSLSELKNINLFPNDFNSSGK
jgi:mannitol-1-phosphate 5-dehydrogenase